MSHTYALIIQCADRNDEISHILGSAADAARAHLPRVIKLEMAASSSDFAEPVLRFVFEEDDS